MNKGRGLRLAAATTIGLGSVAVVPATTAFASISPVCTTTRIYNHAVAMAASNNSLRCYLEQGDTGRGVKYLQGALKYCYGQSIATDGIFGPQTYNALRYAQAVEGITHDGIYGPETATHIWFLYEAMDGSCTKLG